MDVLSALRWPRLSGPDHHVVRSNECMFDHIAQADVTTVLIVMVDQNAFIKPCSRQRRGSPRGGSEQQTSSTLQRCSSTLSLAAGAACVHMDFYRVDEQKRSLESANAHHLYRGSKGTRSWNGHGAAEARMLAGSSEGWGWVLGEGGGEDGDAAPAHRRGGPKRARRVPAIGEQRRGNCLSSCERVHLRR